MSVIVETEDGWIIDHKLESVVTVQKDDPEKGVAIQHYRLRSDLFEIVEPYRMDSQYEKLQTVKSTDDGQKRKRKRKRQVPLNSGEKMAEEFHNEVKKYVWKAYESLLKLGQEAGYFQDPSPERTRDNNKAARQAAQWDGSMQTFIEMCEQSEQEGNQTFQDEHCTGSQQSFTSDTEQTQEDRNQCLTIYHVTEVKDLSVRGAVNVVWQHTGDFSEVIKCRGDNYIIPPHSMFLMSDIKHLNTKGWALGTYDLIAMDPPWTNKSVKRKKKYYTMDNDMMLDLPLSDMMNPGCIVVVWVTNKQKHIHFVTEQLFPAKGIKFIARWFWLKVTKMGQCVFEFDSAHKKPYETILIGRYGATCNLGKVQHDSNGGLKKTQDEKGFQRNLEHFHEQKDYDRTEVNDLDVLDKRNDMHPDVEDSDERSRSGCIHGNRSGVPDNRVIVSVPCSLHSKKPPLQEVLKPFLPEEPKCVELFARNLLPGWTSWGNEVLLHQHINFYEEIT